MVKFPKDSIIKLIYITSLREEVKMEKIFNLSKDWIIIFITLFLALICTSHNVDAKTISKLESKVYLDILSQYSNAFNKLEKNANAKISMYKYVSKDFKILYKDANNAPEESYGIGYTIDDLNKAGCNELLVYIMSKDDGLGSIWTVLCDVYTIRNGKPVRVIDGRCLSIERNNVLHKEKFKAKANHWITTYGFYSLSKSGKLKSVLKLITDHEFLSTGGCRDIHYRDDGKSKKIISDTKLGKLYAKYISGRSKLKCYKFNDAAKKLIKNCETTYKDQPWVRPSDLTDV